MARQKVLISWPDRPEQINPAMLDDLAARVSAAMPMDKKRGKDHIRSLINTIITEHYHGKNETV